MLSDYTFLYNLPLTHTAYDSIMHIMIRKPTLPLILSSLSLALIITKTQLINSIAYFAMTGAIAGTNLSVSSYGMFMLYSGVIAMIVIRLLFAIFQPLITSARQHKVQVNLPKCRFFEVNQNL